MAAHNRSLIKPIFIYFQSRQLRYKVKELCIIDNSCMLSSSISWFAKKPLTYRPFSYLASEQNETAFLKNNFLRYWRAFLFTAKVRIAFFSLSPYKDTKKHPNYDSTWKQLFFESFPSKKVFLMQNGNGVLQEEEVYSCGKSLQLV